jgi:striatin 1/3/4
MAPEECRWENNMEFKHTHYKVGGTKRQHETQLTMATGVMRFLQTEWHRHERDRNAWEIEREEMRNRIANLEGESRMSKGVRISLERHVKLLEIALKKEREKIRNLDKGQPIENHKDAKDVAREELKAAAKGWNSPSFYADLLTNDRFSTKGHQPPRF